jgi:hypothetical protein
LITRAQGVDIQALGDVLAVLLVLVAAERPGRVRDRGHQCGGAPTELPGQDRERILPADEERAMRLILAALRDLGEPERDVPARRPGHSSSPGGRRTAVRRPAGEPG